MNRAQFANSQDGNTAKVLYCADCAELGIALHLNGSHLWKPCRIGTCQYCIHNVNDKTWRENKTVFLEFLSNIFMANNDRGKQIVSVLETNSLNATNDPHKPEWKYLPTADNQTALCNGFRKQLISTSLERTQNTIKINTRDMCQMQARRKWVADHWNISDIKHHTQLGA